MTLRLELAPIVNGVKWRLYPIEFTTVDGKFSAYFYAVTDEHAQAMLDDLKDTAIVGNPVLGVIP